MNARSELDFDAAIFVWLRFVPSGALPTLQPVCVSTEELAGDTVIGHLGAGHCYILVLTKSPMLLMRAHVTA